MKHTGFIASVIIAAATLTAVTAYAESDSKPRRGPPVTFEMLDADGNGQVTQAEMQQHREAHFAETDSNGDGMLSSEEMMARGKDDASERVAKMISRFDENGDGMLSLDEMPEPKKKGDMFARLDKDGNGSISKEEFADARDHMRGHGKGSKMRHGSGQSDKN